MQYRATTGYSIRINQVANIKTFQFLANSGIKVPKPPLYELEDGRMVENDWHPVYQDALQVYDLARHNVILNGIITYAVDLLDDIDYNDYEPLYKGLQAISPEKLSLKDWFIKYYVLDKSIDQQIVVKNSHLCESLVGDIFGSIRVTRGGQDIHKAHVKNAIQTGINTDAIVIAGEQLVSPLDEIKGCNFALMSWDKWVKGEYSLEEKATSIALYRLEKVVETHQSDAVQLYQEQQARKNKKG